MNNVNVSVTLTKDPEIKKGSCILKLSYNKVSGKKCYITAVANGKLATTLKKLVKGDTIWIDGRLSGFNSDKWKTYIEIESAYCVPKTAKEAK